MISRGRGLSHYLPCRPRYLTLPHQRSQSTKATLNYSPSIQQAKAPIVPKQASHYYPTIPTCPPSTCACSATPAGLDIEREGPMAMPEYSRHVVIMTGRQDWQSRIEEEYSSVLPTTKEDQPRANLAKSLKELVGVKGKYYHPDRKILITNCSMSSRRVTPHMNEVMIFPQNIRVGGIWNDPQDHEAFCERFLMSTADRERLKKTDTLAQEREELQANADNGPMTSRPWLFVNHAPVILVCTHGSRDQRCGIMGRQLVQDFVRYTRAGNCEDQLAQDQRSCSEHDEEMKPGVVRTPIQTIVAGISHVGGHKWAGNVIVYLPPSWRTKTGEISPLARKGVWYGRVEPKHVEGIVEETIRGGKIIEDLCRGLHDSLPQIPRGQKVEA